MFKNAPMDHELNGGCQIVAVRVMVQGSWPVSREPPVVNFSTIDCEVKSLPQMMPGLGEAEYDSFIHNTLNLVEFTSATFNSTTDQEALEWCAFLQKEYPSFLPLTRRSTWLSTTDQISKYFQENPDSIAPNLVEPVHIVLCPLELMNSVLLRSLLSYGVCSSGSQPY